MANDENGAPESPMQSDVQMGEAMQIDYSYDQWRHAQMQQVEWNYAAQCERETRRAALADAA